ncbi:glycosyl transferase family 2 [Arcticibacter pallidicorallinus]|uniref:Glycosyl transferase family 2 n=2 Tax=Arcticibacter pallidicorallinus TaxID=1259464 RepID=A0A2T0TS24_9SPHI|nr:glycosyl transferase family 2 [Arcticibacter pallidicorallinus]
MGVIESEVMVSICCITYNHEKYIAEAIDSFLMQETSFQYEILIGEDSSSDGTKAILADYVARYPGRIQVFSSETNLGAVKNFTNVLKRSKGKYIAFCDGDDFWTDAKKLQKQVDFMEGNDDYIICCHYSQVIDDQGKTVYVSDDMIPLEYSYGDLLAGNRKETRVASMLMRSTKEILEIEKNRWLYSTYGTDTFVKLLAVAVSGKKIFVLPELMSCYRVHGGGIWSMVDSKVRKKKMVNDFNLLIDNFSYSSSQKRQLLKMYLKEYFLFDMKNVNVNGAFRTLTNLL